LDVAQPSTQPLGSRRVAGIAWSACGLSLFFILCTLTLDILNGTLDANSSFAIVVVANAVVGGLVASRRPANPVGWLFLGSSVCLSLNGLGGEYAIYLQSGELPFTRAAASITIWSERLGAALLFIFLPLYFPNGRLVSPRWRPIIRLAILFAVVAPVVSAFMPGESVYGGEIIHPLGVEALRPIRDLFDTVGLVLFLGFILFAVASLVARFRRSGSEERQQLKWFMYAVSTVLVWFVINWPIEDATPELFQVMDALVIASVPVAAGIAILKYHLFDIDLIINRTLVYGALTACVVGIYVLVVGYLGTLFHVDGNLLISLVATGLVAVLFQPLRERLQRGINRLMYGERDDPYAVLSRLGHHLETAIAPEAALSTIVETVANALKLPYVAIELNQDGESSKAWEYGIPTGETLILPLTHQSDEVGRMLVAPRSPGEAFSSSDKRLLDDLARQAGSAAHAARLTADLQHSRARLVNAREEERRRLRRDLHDGLGPTLGGLTLGLDAARSSLPVGSDDTRELLSELKSQTQEAVSDIRRLVHGLRPPALDDLGLLAAIRQQAAKYGRLKQVSQGDPGGEIRRENGLTFSVEASDPLPPLPAAIEAAAYRIAQEAVTNVSRHAEAKSCRVDLSVDEARRSLALEVVDDGISIPEDRHAGVGTNSMRERAEELGGSLVIESVPEGGTRVLAFLPLPRKREE
jgi:signal transduction histidine kinase